MTAKRSTRTGDAAHPRTGTRRSSRGSKTDDHAPGRPTPGEQKIDESVEESFPASDSPAHRTDPDVHVKEAPVEGEREPDDDEGGIGGDLRRSGHDEENPDAVERGED
jgi:hypothetical protein